MTAGTCVAAALSEQLMEDGLGGLSVSDDQGTPAASHTSYPQKFNDARGSAAEASGTHQSQQQVQGRAQPPHSERESASSQGRSESSSSRHTDAHSNSMQLFKRRQSSLGPNTATHVYRGGVPLHIVRGQGCHLYCSDGTEYLDCVNNVAHVGHCHPEVAQAVSQQLMTLNTNVRYLHSSIVDFAEELIATLPEQLQVCYYVNSGSECNDLALRIARLARPGATHVAVMAGAYHGHVSSLIDLSPFKFNGQGGGGQPSYVHVLPCPDTYRGLNLDGKAAARAAIAEAHAAGGKLCAFFCESILSCGGQVVLPKGYLQNVYREMRAEGAVCVADEVQCGYGRAGSNFWVFETQDVVPDILTTGKPIGNGFPMSVLVTNRDLAKSFSNGMEYFNTFGGCTAAGAAGLATLQVLKRERLQENAAAVGAHLLQRLRVLQKEHACLGDVRGMGLMQGVEIVTDASSKRPDPALAAELREQMALRHHVLVAIEGPHNNIVKIKPPMCFSHADADRLVDALSDVVSSSMVNRQSSSSATSA